jgi:hypothetical protein
MISEQQANEMRERTERNRRKGVRVDDETGSRTLQDARHGLEAPEIAPSASTAQRKWRRGEERKLHDALLTDFRRRGWLVIHSRMDKPSTIAKGWPDLTVIDQGRAVLIELKAPGGVLSADQVGRIAEIEANGTAVLVTESLAEAIRFAREHLEPPRLIEDRERTAPGF